MTSAFRACAIVPTFNNPDTVRDVVEALAPALPVIVVDDGSEMRARAIIEAIASDGIADVVHHPCNAGKGAAVRTGFEHARRRGFTHAVQVDADGQHDLGDVERFLAAARAAPEALVLGRPRFDQSAPRARRWGRRISIFFVHLETGSDIIDDPLCGYRVYPVASASEVAQYCGNRMEFDIEIAVRMVWAGVPVINLDTHVAYPEGGVSHFRMLHDNARISWMHTRLVCQWWFRNRWLRQKVAI